MYKITPLDVLHCMHTKTNRVPAKKINTSTSENTAELNAQIFIQLAQKIL